MTLLLPLLFKSACPSTHHKLAIDALRFLRGEAADAWRDLFLRFHKRLLAGAIAPDVELKDFSNHVLYVGEQQWGGAVDAANQNFDELAAALGQRRWADAAYAAGVLSHYVSEPFMPLNTRQSDAGNAIQRGIEWSVCRSYGRMQSILEDDFGGYPSVELPPGNDGLQRLLELGAETAQAHYDTLVTHFDLARALIDPEEALDQELQDRMALCLGGAVVSFARILERAIEKSEVIPPPRDIGASGLMASLKSPFRALSCHTFDQVVQRQLEAMHGEWELTGRIEQSLPEEQREIRRRFAEEVRGASLENGDSQEPLTTGLEAGKGAPPRFRPNRLRTGPGVARAGSRASCQFAIADAADCEDQPRILRLTSVLSRQSPIEDAPAIEPAWAARLRSAAVENVGDLLSADPEMLAARMRMRRDGVETIMGWQATMRQRLESPHLAPSDAGAFSRGAQLPAAGGIWAAPDRRKAA